MKTPDSQTRAKLTADAEYYKDKATQHRKDGDEFKAMAVDSLQRLNKRRAAFGYCDF